MALTSLCEVIGKSGPGKRRTSCSSMGLSCPGSISGARARAARCRTAWGPTAVQRCTMAWRWAGLCFLLLMLRVVVLHGAGRGSWMSLDCPGGPLSGQTKSSHNSKWFFEQPG